MSKIIDSHCHIDDERYNEDVDQVVANFIDIGGVALINNNCNLDTMYKAMQLTKKYSQAYMTVGCHPHDAQSYDDSMEQLFIKYGGGDKVVGYGEIGLDFYYDLSPREVQLEVFERQLSVANQLKLPITLHIRDAYAPALEILKRNKELLNCGGVMHCFSGSAEIAKECLKLGLYISFSGTITFKNSKQSEVARVVPIDKVLAETDSPYLTPEPLRGRRNEPSNVVNTIGKLASIYGLTLEQMEETTTANAKRLFTRLNIEEDR